MSIRCLKQISCLIGWVYVFYVGHVDKSSLYETLFHCKILSKHHQSMNILQSNSVILLSVTVWCIIVNYDIYNTCCNVAIKQ
jgi:hypothetical protein